MKLNEIEKGRNYIITYVNAPLNLKYRLYDLGFIEGARISRMRESPLGDPVSYLIKGTVVALRNSDARMIEVAEK